jgi:predicted Zn-dependent peptidase
MQARTKHQLLPTGEIIMSTYIKTTEDGRKVEVIEQAICLAGKKEADRLTLVSEHPNRAAILNAVPNATHMAGRLPLTAEEAASAAAALEAGRLAYESSPKGLAERMRKAQNEALANRDG